MPARARVHRVECDVATLVDDLDLREDRRVHRVEDGEADLDADRAPNVDRRGLLARPGRPHRRSRTRSSPGAVVEIGPRAARPAAEARLEVSGRRPRSSGPSSTVSPFSSQIARSQSCEHGLHLVRDEDDRAPRGLRSSIRPRQRRWNSASPTASTSSTSRISGSRCAATAKASRTDMPLEYRLTGVSMNCSTPANSTMSRNLRAISRRLIPSTEPFRKTFSRPVSSGWKPVPTSSRLPTRPRISARPLGRRRDPREDPEKRRLARAVAPDDAEHLALSRPRTRRPSAPRSPRSAAGGLAGRPGALQPPSSHASVPYALWSSPIR